MADVEKIGTSFVINTIQTGIQFTPAVSALNNGGFVVAWTDFDSGSPDDPSDSAVRAQIFNADSTRAGSEFLVNLITPLAQNSPDIATLSDGSFVIAWTHTFSATDIDVHGQRFAQNGTRIGSTIPIANTGAADEFDASIVRNSTGDGYAVTWTQDDNLIHGRVIAANGSTVSGPFVVDPAAPGGLAESASSITQLTSGVFVTAWQQNNEIMVRRLVGAESAQLANTTTTGEQRQPTVTALENGGYVVVWTDQELFVRGQMFNASGARVGGEFVANGTPGSVDFTTPIVKPLVGGGFFILWDDRNAGLRGQAFNESGVAYGGVVQFTPNGVAGSFGDADVDVTQDGDLVVVWTGAEVEGQIVRAANIENGTAGNDTLVGAISVLFPGAQASDILNGLGGDDVLEGRGGAADTLNGGTGIDTATYAGASSAVTANLLLPAVNLGDALGDTYSSIENLRGSAFSDRLTGNNSDNKIEGLAGNDRMLGQGGNDTLIGSTGNEVMQGGTGNDRYFIGNAEDRALEEAGEGTDQVLVSVSFSLAAGEEIERLNTTSENATTAINLTGNEFGNTIIGNAGRNLIAGGAGNDRLFGLDGVDTFFFNTRLNAATNVDRIDDFIARDDTIRLDDRFFSGLSLGRLSADAFFVGSAAADAEDRIIYNRSTGELIFDRNGSGAGGETRFAILDRSLTLTNADFTVV